MNIINNNTLKSRHISYSDITISGAYNAIGRDSIGITVIGNNNTVGIACSNVHITGNENTVDPGLSNVFIIGSSGHTVTTSNTYILNNVIISLSGATDEQFLQYDLATNTWAPVTVTPGGGGTNLSYTSSPTNGLVTSDSGTDATLTAADATNAGLLLPADFTKLSNQTGTNSGDNATNTTYDNAKTVTDFISITQSVNLDTIESDVAASKTKTDFITVTQPVDLDTLESDTVTNNAKVTNATHTGDATGSTALTVVAIQSKPFPVITVLDDQKYPKYDSGSGSFVMTAITGGGDVVGDDATTAVQNLVAYNATDGKHITELTGTQGDILYHNGSTWAKMPAGTIGQYLITNGTGANPSWGYGAVIHSSKSTGVTTTGANVTPVSVSGAVFSYVASAVYKIWVMGRLNSTAATTGAGIQFDLSSAVTAIDVQMTHPLALGTVTGSYSIADDTSAGVSSGVPAGPLDVPITAYGLLVTGANTGTCQLRLRSETTAVTELLAGTVMVVERVA